MTNRGDEEEWRPVPWAGGWYDVSSHGRVRSWKKQRGPIVERAEEPRMLAHRVNPNGYPIAFVYAEGRRVVRTIHSLVAEAFIGPRPDRAHVCHGDGDRLNNRLSNLRYDSASANMHDAIRHGTVAVGENRENAKLTNAQAIEIRSRYQVGGESHYTLAREFGVSHTTIKEIVKGTRWRQVLGVAA